MTEMPVGMKSGRWSLLAGALLLLGGGLLWWRLAPVYLPRVAIAGGDGGGLPRATPTDEKFDPMALEAAVTAADAMQARALLIMRHDHLVVEHYAAGWRPDSEVDTGDFASALLALTAGVAQSQGHLSLRDVAADDPAQLLQAIQLGTRQAYLTYLSQQIWSRLNAHGAWVVPARSAPHVRGDCCFEARASDWMRVASVLLDDGVFEDERVVPAGWVGYLTAARTANGERGLGVWLAASAHGAEPFAAANVFYLRGPGQTRLWLVPGYQLAVLLVAADAGSSAAWDETRLPNQVIRAVRDPPAQAGTAQLLERLVPGHR